MAYKNLNKNYNPTSGTKIRTNLPIEPIQDVDNTQKTMRIFSDYFDTNVILNSDEYDVVISFFTGKDYSRKSAETIAYVICRQAKLDNVTAMSVIDQLSSTNPQELSNIIAEILNLYRFKSSLIGSKSDNPSPEVVSRNILG
jgi:RNA processing factor Prp31|tara:strand:+ start:995 stop:1420 length:426 start_codon:yes stop_codon:yes gene_type:complete